MERQVCATTTDAGAIRAWFFRALRGLRRLLLASLGLVGALALALLLNDLWVSWRAAPWMLSDPTQAEPLTVALVLGTAPRTHRGRPNPFYRARLEVAAGLYHRGQVRGILVSGDNRTRYYNEPEFMRRDLVSLGVPNTHITLDYAGFRTLDSVVRARKVFGLERFLVISQSYHAKRAVFIARRHGIEAYGYAAADPGGVGGLRIRLREIGARALAIADLLRGRAPKFLGPPEAVGLKADQAVEPDPSGQTPGVAEVPPEVPP